MGVTIPCQILWKEKCAKKMVWNYEWLDEVEEYIFADVTRKFIINSVGRHSNHYKAHGVF